MCDDENVDSLFQCRSSGDAGVTMLRGNYCTGVDGAHSHQKAIAYLLSIAIVSSFTISSCHSQQHHRSDVAT